MNTKDEWLILTNSAKRRQLSRVFMPEDQAILDIDAALNFLLSRVCIDKDGNLTLGNGNATENLENAINHGYFVD